MDPKLHLVAGCAYFHIPICHSLTFTFQHSPTFTFQPQFTNMEGALPSTYYYSAASIQSDP